MAVEAPPEGEAAGPLGSLDAASTGAPVQFSAASGQSPESRGKPGEMAEPAPAETGGNEKTKVLSTVCSDNEIGLSGVTPTCAGGAAVVTVGEKATAGADGEASVNGQPIASATGVPAQTQAEGAGSAHHKGGSLRGKLHGQAGPGGLGSECSNAPAAVGEHQSLADVVSKLDSGSRTMTGGEQQGSVKADAGSSNGGEPPRIRDSGTEIGGAGQSAQKEPTEGFSGRTVVNGDQDQEQPANSVRASESHPAFTHVRTPGTDGAAAGAPASSHSAGSGTESMASPPSAAQGLEAQPQPTADAARAQGSPTARAEQVLDAEIERGLVGRLRDDGEMHLTVQREDLGEIDLRVRVHENGVHARIATAHDETRQLLNSQRSDLEAALQRYNLRLDSFSVDVGGRDGRASLYHDPEQGQAGGGSQHGFSAVPKDESMTIEHLEQLDRSGGGLSVRV